MTIKQTYALWNLNTFYVQKQNQSAGQDSVLYSLFFVLYSDFFFQYSGLFQNYRKKPLKTFVNTTNDIFLLHKGMLERYNGDGVFMQKLWKYLHQREYRDYQYKRV
ncbi:MAG: hypothetical protein IPM95_14385 [Sphingobacteriales bacterium]|nr:hypothetical protein [Sphingobacteriales bacterium]